MRRDMRIYWGSISETAASRRIGWTQMTEQDISVARRDDVAFLDSFVGPKG